MQRTDTAFPAEVAAFFASGGRITACQDFAPKPRPARSAWVDTDTKLVRRPKKIAKPLEVEPERKPPKRYYQPKPSRMNDEAIALIRQYAAEGRSQAAAAKALHVSDKTISRAARNHGIKFVTTQSPQTDEQIADAIRPLMEVGASLEKMRATAKCGMVRLHKVISTHFRGSQDAHTEQ